MELDLDPSVGSRTRTFIGTIFGILWTATPLVAWIFQKTGGSIHHESLLGFSVMFLLLGLAFHRWARETLTKTLLNRQLSGTLGVYMILQLCLELGFLLAGWTVQQSLILHVFGWSLTLAILALWVEPWFAASAAVSMISFLLICASPSWLFPLMILDNLVLTVVLVRIWLPRQDLETVRARRRALQSRARGLLLDVFRRDPSEVPSSE
jgi:serine/threonine-protein kinase